MNKEIIIIIIIITIIIVLYLHSRRKKTFKSVIITEVLKLMPDMLKICDKYREKDDGTSMGHQFGFLSGQCTADATFALREHVEMHRDGQISLYCICIDLEKAEDRVQKVEVRNCWRLREVEKKHIELIQDMHEGSKTNMKCMVATT